MMLAMDVGNSNIKVGLYDGDKLLHSYRTETAKKRTSDEYGFLMQSFFQYIGVDMRALDGVMISSVVPVLNYTLERMVHTFMGLSAMVLSPELDCGISIQYQPKNSLGTDRIANAAAAYALYGGPIITVDFGTATTFGAVDGDGVFLGGAISPGIRTSADALIERAARLSAFELVAPHKAIGNNTRDGLQAGVVYGFSGLVDGILSRMKEELPGASVVATGGLCEEIAAVSREIDRVDKLLTLYGIQHIYYLNKG
ncbi:type III pantothenate kinase [Eubacteriales bacterium OttesenSCG-928-M02]|nr:type III pantothenate kinase [Eubacteriales bacterium OttesenSCG-928-M02]